MKINLAVIKVWFGHFGESPQLIIFLGILVRLPLLFTPLTYNNDKWRQADTASIAYHFYLNGYHLLYPQIFWGGSGPGYVETEFQLYPFLVSILYFIFGEHYALGKFVSLILSILAWSFFYLFAKKVLEETQAAIWALTFLIFSPLYLRYSVAFMPEAIVMLFYIAALYFYVSWVSTSRRSFLFLCSLCTALAILVKPTSIHIGLLFALFALNIRGVSIFRKWEVWLATLIAILPGVFWYLHARNIYLTYGNTFGLFSGGDSKFGNLSMWLSPHFYYSVFYLDIKWVLGIAIIPFIVGLLVAIKKKFNLVVFGLLTIGLYYMIVARYSQEAWGVQYHVYLLPYAALTVGLGLKWVVGNLNGLMLKGVYYSSVFVFFCVTLILFFKMIIPRNDLLLNCADHVKVLVPFGNRIIVSTTSRAFDNGVANNYQEPEIFFYSKRYGWSLPADWLNVEKVAEFRQAGATYFVIYSQDLLAKNPSLSDYLKNNSVQIGPGIESACAIYRFSTNSNN